MVFVFLEGYASGAPPYTTCPDANLVFDAMCGALKDKVEVG